MPAQRCARDPSSLDYFGRWKALLSSSRRFHAPLLLSIEDKPPWQDVDISPDPGEIGQGSVRWSLETLDGKILVTNEV